MSAGILAFRLTTLNNVAETKVCVDCGEQPKRAGHPKWCTECWLPRQAVQIRIAAAKERLAAVPEAQRLSRVPERDWPTGRRWCAGCQSFVRMRDVSTSRCKACSSAQAHASRLKSTYVVHGRPFTDADYDDLLRAQQGRCYLCLRESKTRRLVVDHDHISGEVRGLLCPSDEWGCNLKILPRFDADPSPLQMVERLRLYLSGDTPASRLPRTR